MLELEAAVRVLVDLNFEFWEDLGEVGGPGKGEEQG
jgi:hypothetical protein